MQLWAKSTGPGGKSVCLSDHTRAVSEAAYALYGRLQRPTRLALETLRFFRLDESAHERLLTNILLAAIFHDLGKANDTFQKALQRRTPQAIRHEHLSALLLYLPEVREWLKQSPVVDLNIVASAVVSHHLKVTAETFARRHGDAGSFLFYGSADCVRAIFEMAGNAARASAPSVAAADVLWSFDGNDGRAVRTLRDQFLNDNDYTFKKACRRDETRRRLLLAVKAGLIAADSAGSAVVRLGLAEASVTDWIEAAFVGQLTARDIAEKVINPRIEKIKSRQRSFRGLHDFQIKAADLGHRALLLSGCGTGKTLAAWKWIEARLRERPRSRVLFLYPTRGTSTEGFRDYVSWAGPEAALLHGTSAYDLEAMFENPRDERDVRDYEVDARMFALGYWPKRIFSATVDSFLAFMQNKYAPLCMLPILADSVVVVDEVHSFDEAMFRALVNFLKFFDAPVLCMTASLPIDRCSVLTQRCGLQQYPPDPSVFPDLQRQAALPRYRVAMTDGKAVRTIASDALRAGKRVLWVVNTVTRCQSVARAVGRESLPEGTRLLCYHSRFRRCDRRDRHEEVVRLFREHEGSALVVATQVCEMSLDLDADVLITEYAPVPSLIQRMGRCCRQPEPPPDRMGLVYAYPPEDERPYQSEKGAIEQGEHFLREMACRGDVGHADLSAYLERMEVAEPFVEEGYSSFLDSGWAADSKERDFREGDEFTVDCVLDRDVEKYLDAKERREVTDGFIVPVPKRLARFNEKLGRFLRDAPASQYSLYFGFMSKEPGDAC